MRGSLQDVATEVGVSPRTLRRWLHEDGKFRQALREADAEMFAMTARSLSGLVQQAIGILADTMQSREASRSEHLRAAECTLKWVLQYRDFALLSARIERIAYFLEQEFE